VTIVGCEPESLEEGAELSEPVARAVEATVPLVLRVARELSARELSAVERSVFEVLRRE
jgi:Ni,Fe-hydrogenase maturation factor